MSLKSTYSRAKLFWEGLPDNDSFLVLFSLISLVVLLLGYPLAAFGLEALVISFILTLDFHQKTWAYRNKKIDEELAAILKDQR